MNTRQRIVELVGKIGSLGPMLPGSISQQYNVCGKPHCRCKDPDNPVKHGPYYQLSYTVGGRSSSMFVKRPDLPAVQAMIARHKQLKELFTELTGAYVELVRSEGVSAAAGFIPVSEEKEQIQELTRANAELEHTIKALLARCAKWRTKADERTKTIESYRTKVRDLEISRENWKGKAKQARATIRTLEEQVVGADNEIDGGKKNP